GGQAGPVAPAPAARRTGRGAPVGWRAVRGTGQARSSRLRHVRRRVGDQADEPPGVHDEQHSVGAVRAGHFGLLGRQRGQPRRREPHAIYPLQPERLAKGGGDGIGGSAVIATCRARGRADCIAASYNANMTLELSDKQREALGGKPDGPVYLLDPVTLTRYVLLPDAAYERARALFEE